MTTTTLTTRSSLSIVVSALLRAARSFDEMYEQETSFDGGEFSGPAMSEGYDRERRASLKRHGWTAVGLVEELQRRGSGRQVDEFLGLISDLYARCSQCGVERDVVGTSVTQGFDPSVVVKLSCGHVEL